MLAKFWFFSRYSEVFYGIIDNFSPSYDGTFSTLQGCPEAPKGLSDPSHQLQEEERGHPVWVGEDQAPVIFTETQFQSPSK